MCGIAGFFCTEPDPDLSGKIHSAIDVLSHRGPDDKGVWVDPGSRIALGNTRLSVIDLEGGRQPIRLADVPVTVVMNGEIYNHDELRSRLQADGCRFHTRSDTEVIGQALVHWGVDGLRHLNGMFAVALFDGRDGSLLLARDRVGIKPLYLYEGEAGWAFASEPKAIQEWGPDRVRVDPLGVMDYMTLGYSWYSSSLIEGMSELQPGSWRILSDAGCREGRYWEFRTAVSAPPAGGWKNAVKRRLTESIEDHLVADVEVGCFLSGGIDSSLIVGLLYRELGRKVPVFTVSFPGHEYDEVESAREAAKYFGAEHHVIEASVGEGDPDLVETIMDQFDTPFADSSAIPSWMVSEAIRSQVKVAIGGDGGDEGFGGYRRFRHADHARKLGRLPRSILQGGLAAVPSTVGSVAPGLARGFARLAVAALHRDSRRFLPLAGIVNPRDLEGMMALDESFLDQWWSGLETRLDAYADPGGIDFREFTFGLTLHGDYLRKVDVASSAHGLEVRVPFLGNAVLELVATLPWQLAGGSKSSKPLLRELAADILPASLLSRPKQGFSIPLHRWFKDAGRREVARRVQTYLPGLEGVIESTYAADLLERFVQVRPGSSMSEYGLYQRVFQLWSLARWTSRANPVWPAR